MPNYWLQRDILQREALLDKSIADTEKELASQYKKTMKVLKRDMEGLYDEVLASKADGTILASDLYRFNRYYDLLNAIQYELRQLGTKENLIFDKRFTKLYNQNEELLGKHLGFTGRVDEGAVKRAVDAIWCSDGLHWSERVWKHKEELANRLERGLIDCVARGASRDELTKQIMYDFNVGYNEADRITRTELSHIQNQSTLDKYKAAGIDEYEFLAELDNRTSNICRELNGKRFKMAEAEVGINLPPMHPNCRSTILAVLE